MNMLQIVQEFAVRTGLPKPSAVALSRDAQVVQLMGLLNEVVDDLLERGSWQQTKVQANFSAVAAEEQGDIESFCTGNFSGLVENIFYNNTQKTLIFAEDSSVTWQMQQAGIRTISSTKWRIIQNILYMVPTPTVDDLISFEYFTRDTVDYITIDIHGVSTHHQKQYFTVDSDTSLFPAHLLLLGLRWLWRREKGLRYTENFRAYEAAVANLLGKSTLKNPIDMSEEYSPSGLTVPDQSWVL